jgi:hypothetical protein
VSCWVSLFTGFRRLSTYELIAHYHWTFGEDKFYLDNFFMATGSTVFT